MAPLSKPISLLCLIILCFSPTTLSLSTVAISETSNTTLVCAIIHSPSLPHRSSLNCTSFPGGKPVPLNSRVASSLTGIVAGDGFLCALRSYPLNSSSFMSCWRSNSSSVTGMYYKRVYRGSLVKDLASGNSHICGLVNSRLQCWQWKEFNSTAAIPPDLRLSSIAVGSDFVCGLSEFGNIVCSHKPNWEIRGNYSVVSAGFRHACGVSLNGSVVCWGETPEPPPEGEFRGLALGENRSCAMRPNGTVTCWGENSFSLPMSLKSTLFISIVAKRRVFCGIVASNYSLICWGSEVFNSSPVVFRGNVVPGSCTTSCPCSRPLLNYRSFCDGGLMICEPCAAARSPPSGSSPSPPASPTPPSRRRGIKRKELVAFLVVGCVGTLSLVVVIVFSLSRRYNVGGSRVHDSGRLDEEVEQTPPPPPAAAVAQLEKRLSQMMSMGNGNSLEEFSLQVLIRGTDNFSQEYKIGTGSFGTVYLATLDDSSRVAIKRAETSASSLSPKIGQQDHKDTAFLNELEFLSRLNHKNLVRLLGYCEEDSERILVYDYVENGSLQDHLHNKDVIGNSVLSKSWVERIKVALGAARGIEYLHVYAVPPIIHRDIKSSNILIDGTWTAKVSDFGLSLMGPYDEDSHLSLTAAGTVGYMDPEYYRLQQLTSKSDVYSFGVVLLEMLSGCKAIHVNENGVPRNVVDYVVPYIVQDEIHRVLDPNVPAPTPFEIEGVAYVGYLAADCVTRLSKDRPTMTEVVNGLERALAACLAPPPWPSSPTEEWSM